MCPGLFHSGRIARHLNSCYCASLAKDKSCKHAPTMLCGFTTYVALSPRTLPSPGNLPFSSLATAHKKQEGSRLRRGMAPRASGEIPISQSTPGGEGWFQIHKKGTLWAVITPPLQALEIKMLLSPWEAAGNHKCLLPYIACCSRNPLLFA